MDAIAGPPAACEDTGQDMQRALERLHALEARDRLLHGILEHSPDLIKILDSEGRVIFTNDKWLHQKVCKPALVVEGWPWVDCWPTMYRDTIEDALQRVRHGETSRFTASRTDQDGTTQWFDVVVRPMAAVDGSSHHVLAISRDATVQHQQDQELRAAKEKAEAASIAKAAFLADMSHELRTPLGGILGHADLLLSDATLTPEQSRRATRILEAGNGLLRIVNDVLDVAKIEAGGVDLQNRTFDIKALLESMASLMRPAASRKKLDLNLCIPDAMPASMIGDPDRLKQIVLNLLGNAIKFTERGHVALGAAVSSLGPRRCAFAIRVGDTGPGISSDTQHLLFKRFSQLDASISRRYGGTGLGPAISSHLVERMGGRIEVESEMGKGATFSICLDLPLAEPAQGRIATSHAPERARFDARVLVVEDNLLNQELAVDFLTHLGCEAVVVPTGEDAVAAVRTSRFDLVLMDEQMPGMSGTATARVIRSLGSPHGDLPIVACTANVFWHHLEAFENAGMNGHIAKPLTRSGLAETLAAHVPPAKRREASDPIEEVPAGLDWLSPPQYRSHLADLCRDLGALDAHINKTGTDATRLAKETHGLISTAAILGFKDLSLQLQAFERSCLGHPPPQAATTRLSHAIHEASAAIEKQLHP